MAKSTLTIECVHCMEREVVLRVRVVTTVITLDESEGTATLNSLLSVCELPILTRARVGVSFLYSSVLRDASTSCNLKMSFFGNAFPPSSLLQTKCTWQLFGGGTMVVMPRLRRRDEARCHAITSLLWATFRNGFQNFKKSLSSFFHGSFSCSRLALWFEKCDWKFPPISFGGNYIHSFEFPLPTTWYKEELNEVELNRVDHGHPSYLISADPWLHHRDR